MKPLFTKLVAALTVGAAMVASVPAEARDWRGGYSRDHGRWDDRRSWRGDRWDRGGYRWDRGYRGYGGPRGRYYAPRYYGYGYGYPRYRHYYRDRDGGDVALGALAGIAIGAAIASSND